ncbi:NAD-dependent epimerase/dehydratase family protein [Glycomyces sp. TRM65418]|uniref:NAD-dependent epimerase/dehydratase family protein n=1 Tax=Glycomyces sp. TRM65418 TaxID=2867006 RepID=UPI001CE57B73|nr:NAD-dependent epimerase/dehydratase family protein [Glycomyces sp. TRM65418]MCC3763477.1 NAD-dependent epimerase/dehydratase family protein [Glycomyces sp. TRM65418]QZD57464.1 NAD-dependent epimerase/dehydratase family protein [Glycomyces sp. TRM65418]
MADICVIGGTRFFGKFLVDRLIHDGHDVTVLTRGRTPDPFGDAVRRIVADATDADSLAAAVASERFDAVVHQMCYDPRAAAAACEAFGERAGKWVLTSSMEVYNADTFRWEVPAPPMSAFAREAELDPAAYRYDLDLPWDDPEFAGPNYGEGKRQAEAAMLDRSVVPLALARIAHVLDARDDFTGRVRFHVERIRSGLPITAHASPGRTSLVPAAEAAAFLAWAAVNDVTGAVNAAAPDPVDVHAVCAAFAQALGREATVVERADPSGDEALSPYSCPADFGMNVEAAAALGFAFTPAASWLPEMARAAEKAA